MILFKRISYKNFLSTGNQPIEIALAFVLNQTFPSFPLIGPRNFFETESSLKALNINLSDQEMKWLDLKDN